MNKTRQMPRQNHMQKMFVDKCLPWVLDIPACNILAREHTEWLCKSINWICSTYFYIKCLVHTSLLFMGKYECKSFKGLQHPCSSVKLKSDCHSNSLHIMYARHYKPRLVYFYPIFQDHFFVFKEVFSENSVLIYGLYLRAASNQEWLIMAHVQ